MIKLSSILTCSICLILILGEIFLVDGYESKKAGNRKQPTRRHHPISKVKKRPNWKPNIHVNGKPVNSGSRPVHVNYPGNNKPDRDDDYEEVPDDTGDSPSPSSSGSLTDLLGALGSSSGGQLGGGFDTSKIVEMVTQLFNNSPELNDFIQNMVNGLQSSDVSKEMINNLIQFFGKHFNQLKANRSLIGPTINRIISDRRVTMELKLL